jgi:acetyl-CoA acetyltransferase family protein
VKNETLVFVAAKRTPFGSFGGSFKDLTATDLAERAARGALEQLGAKAEDLDATVWGNVAQTAADAIYLPRHVGLRLGMPLDRPALGVNRLCGSGFEALVQGAYLLREEGMKAVLVGGSESMSQAPYALRGARWGYRMGNGELEDTLSASLTDAHVKLPMAITAENLALKYGFSREDCDKFALESQQRAAAAWAEGRIREEITPVKLVSRKGETVVERDEHMRADSSLAGLAKLAPVFKKDGVVTAGNASGITDGACALVLTTESHAKAKGWKVLGRLSTWAFVGCDPTIMGIGPVPATQKALARWSESCGSKKTVADFKRVEVNEAFAAQYLAVEKELGLKREITNADGGAISIGHPLAASGARLVTHLLYTLPRLGGGAGLASACIGGGQGMSVVVEV